jgi:tagatose 1,6-diphosphate aldolase
MSLSQGKIEHMNRLSNKHGVIAAAAMDQRGSLAKSIAKAKGVDQKDITDEMMEEFKIAVSRILTPHASAILLDPEWGLPAAKARAKNAGLLLAYEGPDTTIQRRAVCPICCRTSP